MSQSHRSIPAIPRAVLVASFVLLTACGAEPDAGPGTIDTVQLKLDFGGGVALDNVDFLLTGPNNFRRTGTLPVGAQDSITTTFQNLPAGMGYDVVVKGTATDDANGCKGEAVFNVASSMTAVVQISLVCSGRTTVTADFNVCPLIDTLWVLPAEVYVGSSMQVTVGAHDPDNGPSPLMATWQSTSGSFSNVTATSATFTCTAPGAFRVGVTISDGTPSNRCDDSASLMVVCTVPPTAMLMSAAPARAGAV